MTRRNGLLTAFTAAPILLLFGMLARETVNIPFLDDYTGVLKFLADWSALPSRSQKLVSILTAQHNEYKLILANALFALQYALSGHVNFAVLSTVGNLLLLPLFAVVIAMWREDKRPVSDRLLLFAPVPWLLFQLQYYSLLNWPMSSMQHVIVMLFSLLTIYLLSRNRPRSFYLALPSLCLSIASSGNGFFVVPIGFAMLLQFGRRAWIVSWAAVSGVMLALYLYRYNFRGSTAHADHSIVSSLYHLSPLYSLSFLGATIARYGAYLPAVLFGICLCGLFVYAAFDGFYRTNPAIFYSMAFILITSVAVSGLRSDFGIGQSLVSRYRINSNLLVIFSYLYLAGKHFATTARLKESLILTRRRFAVVAIVAAVLFNLASNYAGYRLLHIRTELTKEGLYRWERGEVPITQEAGAADEDPVIRRQRLHGNYAPEDKFLREAIDLGIYAPPAESQSAHRP